MFRDVLIKKRASLVSAGTLLAMLGLVGFSAVQGQDTDGGRSWLRRSRRASERNQAKLAPADVDEDEDDILQILQEETTAPPAEPAPPAENPPAFGAAEKETPPEEPAAAPDPWTLTNLFNNPEGGNTLKEAGVKISGHMQWGYQSAPDGAFTGNGPFVNQYEWGQFNLNQQYLFMEKVADGSKGIGWGFRVDGMYGVDGNEGQSFGNVVPNHWDYQNGLDHGAYEWAVPQAYGELAYKKWSIKMGHFYTIVGYEVVPSTGQFFLSRQLTFWNSEPFTHTGALASYKPNDKLTIMGGWVAGMDSGYFRFEQASAFLGGFTWLIDPKTTFVYSMIGGNLGWRGDGAINSFILSRQWLPKFSTVHQFDVLATNLRQTPAGLPGGTLDMPADFNNPASYTPRDSTGLINYAFYDLTPKLKAGIRYEWYKADSVSYNTLTFGVNIKPKPYLIIRPEVRGMWSPGNHQTYTGAHGYSSQLFNQTVFGIDAIVTF